MSGLAEQPDRVEAGLGVGVAQVAHHVFESRLLRRGRAAQEGTNAQEQRDDPDHAGGLRQLPTPKNSNSQNVWG
jgi:hypothetical protein